LGLIDDVTTSERPVSTPSYIQVRYQAKGGAIYPFTAYQGAEILYIYML
jgi:hypothetical protein